MATVRLMDRCSLDVHWQVVDQSSRNIRLLAESAGIGMIPAIRRKLAEICQATDEIRRLNRQLLWRGKADPAAVDLGILTLTDALGELLADEVLAAAVGSWMRPMNRQKAAIRGAIYARRRSAPQGEVAGDGQHDQRARGAA